MAGKHGGPIGLPSLATQHNEHAHNRRRGPPTSKRPFERRWFRSAIPFLQLSESPAKKQGQLKRKDSQRYHIPLSFLPFSNFCFQEQKLEILLIFLSCYGRLYEKILSRQRKPPSWILKLESPCLLASSRPLTRTTKQAALNLKLKPQPTRRFKSPSLNTSQPDGRVNSLLPPKVPI